ncbi:hypothetical protein LX36DRAFT_591619, partial [Colletotrichum falcatum]
YWTKKVIDMDQRARSKIPRQINSKAFKPDYTFTASVGNFSLGEIAASTIVSAMLISLSRHIIVNGRPLNDLGWVKKETLATQHDILNLIQIINKASGLITDGENEIPHARID